MNLCLQNHSFTRIDKKLTVKSSEEKVRVKPLFVNNYIFVI